MKFKTLVITPVNHIKGVARALKSIGCVDFLDNPAPAEVLNIIEHAPHV